MNIINQSLKGYTLIISTTNKIKEKLFVKKGLQLLCKSADMQTVNKRMMSLHRDRDKNFSVFFIVFSPVQKRSCVIFLSRICVLNMCICYPRHWRALKNIISQRSCKILRLTSRRFCRQQAIFSHIIFHRDVDDLKQLCFLVYTKHHLKFGKNQADNLEYM